MAEKCLTIYSRDGICTLVNDGLNKPIKIKNYSKAEFTPVEKMKPLNLKNGDTLFFEMSDDAPATIVEVGNQKFGLIRMAMFMEV